MVVFNTTEFSQNYCNGSISHRLNLPHIKSKDKWTIDVEGTKYILEQDSATKSGYPSAFREYLLVPIYCGIHTFSQYFYNFYHYQHDLAFFNRVSNVFLYLENIVKKSKENKAATPYQIALFLIILLLLNYLRIRFSSTKRIIRRLDELYKRIQAK
ncbi:hypothetical protein [Candidatus Marithrix sp. Canyon 246]|nr:hypothetical protein [Candidatus Marithrix sp. Canyon 246]